MYAASINDPNGFWAETGPKRIVWMTPVHQGRERILRAGISFESNGRGRRPHVALNLHRLAHRTRRRPTAIIWEGDNPSDSKHLTYRTADEVCDGQHPAHPHVSGAIGSLTPSDDRKPPISSAGFCRIGATLGGFRGFRRQSGASHHRLPIQSHHHRRRRAACCKKVPLKAKSTPRCQDQAASDLVVVSIARRARST